MCRWVIKFYFVNQWISLLQQYKEFDFVRVQFDSSSDVQDSDTHTTVYERGFVVILLGIGLSVWAYKDY